jgi:hypothetical protein
MEAYFLPEIHPPYSFVMSGDFDLLMAEDLHPTPLPADAGCSDINAELIISEMRTSQTAEKWLKYRSCHNKKPRPAGCPCSGTAGGPGFPGFREVID